MNILLTGGAGYIGSHTFVALCAAGFKPVILDNFSNSRRGVLPRLEQITGTAVILEEGDVCDRAFVEAVIKRHGIEAVVHFAALKSVRESIERPILYYRNNISGLVALLEAMAATGCRRLVYSGSATVYGLPDKNPVPENAALRYASVYGHSKLMGEQMLAAIAASDPSWQIASLRYFNPGGAHESGLIGEDGKGVPNNLMPYISQVATGVQPYLQIFGNDYETPDGTGVRDYIHVMDLAEGHVAALKKLGPQARHFTLNLGTGRGYSVMEILSAYEKAAGRKIPYQMAPRRPGDVAIYYADPSLAERFLGWKAKRGIDEMCQDAWRWQSQNPQGFSGV